jgi:hypothetical protein
MKYIKTYESENIEENGECFVFLQGNTANEEHYYDLVHESNNDNLILYPERAMTFADTVDYRRYVKSIVTENPFIISCYPREHVWILQDDEWIHPEIQTYGSSVSIITDDILQYRNTIPTSVMGGERFKDKVEKLKNYND